MTPTPEDLARDLAADLNWLQAERHACNPVNFQPVIGRAVLFHVIFAAIRRALAAEARVRELEADLAKSQAVAESLAARCAGQSELLGKRAEKGGGV